MKNLFALALVLTAQWAMAQDVNSKPLFEEEGGMVKATYYHDNGVVAQTGYYLNGEVHGDWMAFDQNGNRISEGHYDRGVKTGKWFFWSGSQLNEVDYSDNRIASVKQWNQGNSLVGKD